MESSGGSEARPDDTTRPLSLRRGAVHALLQSTGKPKRTGQKLKRRTSLSKLTGGRFGEGKHRSKAKDALKKKLTRYRVLVDGFDAWAAANDLSTEAATAAIDARLAKREMTKVLADFGSVLSAKRQRTE